MCDKKLQYLYLSQKISGDKTKEDGMGEACNMNRDKE
jgi:hypothetical protein